LGSFGLLALYVVGFIAIFYFLAIRPQQRQRKAHDALVSSIKRGDRVISVGGIHGKVKRTEDNVVVIEIAKGVDIRLSRKAIAEVMLPEASPDLTQWFADYLACAADPETVASLIHAQVRLNVEDLLSKIEAPVLIMQNRDDKALTVMASHVLASQLPSARLLIFEGTSNQPFYGDRASILGAVEGFLGADARLRVMNDRDRHLAAGHLTPRETEISRLLARGFRNREIAEQLCLSERTVETHVANLLGKLGLSSRSQLAAMDREANQQEALRTG